MADTAQHQGQAAPTRPLLLIDQSVSLIYRIISIVTGASTIFGWIVAHFRIDLAAMIDALVRAIRSITHPIVEFLFSWLHITLNDLQKDLIVLYVALAGVMLRTCYRLVEAIGESDAGQARRSQAFFTPAIDRIVFGARWSRWVMALLLSLLWPVALVLFFRRPIVCRSPGRTKYAFVRSEREIPTGPVRPHFAKEFDLRLEFLLQLGLVLGFVTALLAANWIWLAAPGWFGVEP